MCFGREKVRSKASLVITIEAEKFVAEFLPYVEEYGLSMREVLHFAAGPHRKAIPERWYWVPTVTG